MTRTDRPGSFPRPRDERRVVRRKSFATVPCKVDEAVETEAARLRLSSCSPIKAPAPPVSSTGAASDHQSPAGSMPTTEQATKQFGLLGLPFLFLIFFIDATQGRASVLHHRGLITPAGSVSSHFLLRRKRAGRLENHPPADDGVCRELCRY